MLPVTSMVAQAPMLPVAAVPPTAAAPVQPQLLAPMPAAVLPAAPSVAVPPTPAGGSVSALSITSLPAPVCTDVPPGSDFTCQQQVGMPAAALPLPGQATSVPVARSLTMAGRQAACCRPLTWLGTPAAQHNSFSALPLQAMHAAVVMLSGCVLIITAAVAACTSCFRAMLDEE